MKIRFLVKSLLVSCLFFVAAGILAESSSAAPRLYFDPASVSSAVDTDLTVNLKVDVENESVFGADAIITFPSSDLVIKSVSKGEFFTDFGYAINENQIEMHGYFSAAYQFKSGGGTLATITLTPKKAAGQGNLAFICSGSGNDTNILNSSGNNILLCSSLSQLIINYGQDQIIVAPSDSNEPTNSCGGTCGSNYNCDSGLFCYRGFCRNPNCPSTQNCSCTSTTPTTKPTIKPLSIKTPVKSVTPQVVTLNQTTPPPSPDVTSDTAHESSKEAVVGILSLRQAAIAGGAILGLGLVVLLIKLIRKRSADKNKIPPTTNPPATGSGTTSYPITPPPNPPQGGSGQF